MDWIELIKIYAWTIPAGIGMAIVLSLIGIQLASRDRAMQVVCLSQSSIFGVLLALGLLPLVGITDFDDSLWPALISLIVTAITYHLTERLSKTKKDSVNTLFSSLFALFVAGGYFLSGLFPALESHMAQIYFGDLATLSDLSAMSSFFISALIAIFLFSQLKKLTKRSFQLTNYGKSRLVGRGGRDTTETLFLFLILGVISFSVFQFGFLFTISFLFIPTSVFSVTLRATFKSHILACCLSSALSVFCGILFSLSFTQFPTVPSMVILLLIICLACSSLFHWRRAP